MNNEQGQLDALKDALRQVAERLDETSRTGTSQAAVQRNLAIVPVKTAIDLFSFLRS